MGGIINAKLHPMPDFKLDKDGKITAIAPQPAPGGHGEGEGKASAFLRHRSAAGGQLRGRLRGALPADHHGGDGARTRRRIDSVQKNMPLIRNNLLLLMSNRDYQSLMSREGKEKLRQEALAEIRAVQKKQGGAVTIDDLLFTSFVVQ